MAGIYIHIPFCRSRCGYCDFYRITDLQLIEKYINSLENEIIFRSKTFRWPVKTVYFGGGTPSLLSPHQLKRILLSVYKNFDIGTDIEISCECNPDDLSVKYLNGIRETGINRLSIGVQSLHDCDLRIMNRRHTSKQAVEAVENAVMAGFKNIGADLIYGLPWSSTELFAENLKRFIDLPIKHLSAYHLTIENGTPFCEINLKILDDYESEAQYLLLCNELYKCGMEHYEISNFCVPNYYSQHNSQYWNNEPYLGIGAGAHSYFNGRRCWNRNDVRLYCTNRFDAVCEEEILDKKDLFNEQIMLGLRTKRGVNLLRLHNEFGCFSAEFELRMEKWRGMGVLYVNNNHLICREDKWFIVDGVIEDFIIV